MSSSVYCPRDLKTNLMSECLSCDYIRHDDDTSSIWCRYNIGRTVDKQGEIRDLTSKLQRKEENMARAYKMGRTKLAGRLMYEIENIRKEIQKLKEDNDSGS